MEVILLKPFRKLGNIGDTAKVALGYAKNYLIPENIAMRATDASKEEIKKQKQLLLAEAAQFKNIAEKKIIKFSNKTYRFIKNASHDGKLYGSLAAKEIAKQISSDDCPIKGEHVVLSTPIRSTGIHQVKLVLYPQVECDIFLAIGSTQAESDMLISKAINSKESKNPEHDIVTNTYKSEQDESIHPKSSSMPKKSTS